jgi:hypothetical protein
MKNKVLEINQTNERYFINRFFSIEEKNFALSKLQYVIFYSLYKRIEQFHQGISDKYIEDYSSYMISVSFPLSDLNFESKDKKKVVTKALDQLTNLKIREINKNEKGKITSSDFINIFLRAKLTDEGQIIIDMSNLGYHKMMPIEYYFSLNTKTCANLKSGNNIAMYAMFESLGWTNREFDVEVDDLRKWIGFNETNTHKQFRDLNRHVIKPAIKQINEDEHSKIKVFMKDKIRGHNKLTFLLQRENSSQQELYLNNNLNLNDDVAGGLNMIQNKYVNTLIKNCLLRTRAKVSNPTELKQWIINDLKRNKEKESKEFDFKKVMNFIAKQLIDGDYTMPYATRYINKC